MSPRIQLRSSSGEGASGEQDPQQAFHNDWVMEMSLKAGSHLEKVVKSLNALRQVEIFSDYRLKGIPHVSCFTIQILGKKV